jgi:hypothetical protein
MFSRTLCRASWLAGTLMVHQPACVRRRAGRAAVNKVSRATRVMQFSASASPTAWTAEIFQGGTTERAAGLRRPKDELTILRINKLMAERVGFGKPDGVENTQLIDSTIRSIPVIRSSSGFQVQNRVQGPAILKGVYVTSRSEQSVQGRRAVLWGSTES